MLWGFSRKFGELATLVEGYLGPTTLATQRATHHACHKLYRLLVAQALLAPHRAPRLEVQGDPYGTAKQQKRSVGCPPTLGECLLHPFPVRENGLHRLVVRLLRVRVVLGVR